MTNSFKELESRFVHLVNPESQQALVGFLVIGGLIVLLASSNAHMVETRLSPLAMIAPHFVILGITFFLGFATGIVSVLMNVFRQRKLKAPGKSMVIKR